ncbi:FecR family protein [Pedobacter sp. ASV28]|uniref:FecR family protein n=1 Tax=Pedobacter sp. ASV28 TaxID=2795123 RepID=UPI0018EC02FF|nr:FecR domain-containing protein [Pedobacter sp. ASV28]
MDIKGIDELLERYRNNKCTAKEKEILEQWFDAQSEGGSWEWTAEEEITSGRLIKERIDQQIAVKQKNWNFIVKIAAAIIVFFCSFLFLKEEIYNIIDPVVYIEKQVLDGKQLQLTLSDGSKVWLNANSKFKYPEKFNRANREVFLIEGEAYFDVTHNEDKPFIVVSKNLTTQVLGTAFNVKAYTYLGHIQIAVTRGKVRVSENSNQDGDKANSILLLPDEQVTVRANTGVMQKESVDANNVIAWQKGNLSFNNDRLVDVCATLSHKYKVKIYFEQESIKEYRLTAGFSQGDRLEDILLVLSSANNLAYQLKGDTVFFQKK